MAKDWSREEVELAVHDYLGMLLLELEGKSYNKTTTRRALMKKLNNRSDGSVEAKRMNISAALFDLGFPAIDGYKPYFNYQSVIADVLKQALIGSNALELTMQRDMRRTVVLPTVDDILTSLEAAPAPNTEAEAPKGCKDRQAKFSIAEPEVNYLQQEAANTQLGEAGEEFCIRYEKARLIHQGRESLADRVEQVSRTIGPSAGYDIRSFEVDGNDRFIEAKTTRYGKLTPFYISPNELRFSDNNAKNYQLYRVFRFERSPGLFAVPGSVRKHFSLKATEFSASVR